MFSPSASKIYDSSSLIYHFVFYCFIYFFDNFSPSFYVLFWMDITIKISDLSLDETMDKPSQWDVSTWTVGSISVPCVYCAYDRDCSFACDRDTNMFVSACPNTRCIKKKTNTVLANLYCVRKQCRGNFSVLKSSYMMDDSGKIWNCCICSRCNASVIGPYTCINRNCHYPLVLCDARVFNPGSAETLHLNYGCARCFSDAKKRYKITIYEIECHEKEIISDPTLSRSDNMACPKCIIIGSVASMEGQDSGLFSYRFYCINPRCNCYWKIDYI